MSIYNATGHQTNSIDLAQYDDIDRLNELMIAEGFRKMTEEEREVQQEKEKARKKKELEMAEKRNEERRERARRLSEERKIAKEAGADPNVVRARDKQPHQEGVKESGQREELQEERNIQFFSQSGE